MTMYRQLLFLGLILCFFSKVSAQTSENPWRETQLMPPAELAKSIREASQKEQPLILAVNPDGMYGLPYKGGIEGAIWFGPSNKSENLEKLTQFLTSVAKDKEIVLYCGCCPFDMCPNIRPAFEQLNALKFTNHKLLDLSENIKEDWIDKGFPMKNTD